MYSPYEGIALLLELVAQNRHTQKELDDLVINHKEIHSLQLYYNPGKDDILCFCHKKLGLFDIVDNRFQLSAQGSALYQYLNTPEFGMQLFLYLVECSKENFTYFHRVYEALEMLAQRGEFELPLSVFNSLLIEKSNRRSNKEIGKLLIGCGAVHKHDDRIQIDPDFFSVDLLQKQLERLWSETIKILRSGKRMDYQELVAELNNVYPSVDWSEIQDAFRSGLMLTRTRASEYVDGLRGGS